MSTLLELIGLSLVGAFLYLVWPPLVLLAAGLLLVAVARRVDLLEAMSRRSASAGEV